LHGIDRFLVVLLPFKVIGQDIVKRRSGILSVAPRVSFRLRFAFRFDGYHARNMTYNNQGKRRKRRVSANAIQR